MNDLTCDCVIRMLNDRTTYLAPKKSHSGTGGYMLYQGNANPVKWFSPAQVSPLKDLLKKDKNKRLTLNLTLVRQLHGKSFIKQQYKIICSKKEIGLKS